jgi:cytochrome P450
MWTALEACVTLVAAWPIAALISIPAFRHTYPRVSLGLGCLAVGYALAVAGVARFHPALLHPAAALAACALVYERWRARPGYGRSRGLPPGSLALVPRRPWSDDRFYEALAAEYGPVFKVSLVFRPIVCVVGHERGFELLQRHDPQLRPPAVRYNRFIPRGFLRYMNRSDHRVYRELFDSALTGDVVRACESFIGQSFRRELQNMADDCARAPGVGVRPDSYIDRMLFSVFARVFFGITPDMAQFGRLRELFGAIDTAKVVLGSDRRQFAAQEEISAILRQQLEHFSKLAEAGSPVPPSFLAKMLEANPAQADDPTVLGNFIYMFRLGQGDVRGMLRWVLKLLADHPDWARRARDEVDARDETGGARPSPLAARIVRETLRLEQSEYLYRRTLRDIEVEDFVVPRGWLVRICIREGHRDPAVFDAPASFDPDRFLGRSHARTEYSPFGVFEHRCPGAHLAQTIGQVVVSEIVGQSEWRLAGDGPREYGPAHWEPSSRFRLEIGPRVVSADGSQA